MFQHKESLADAYPRHQDTKAHHKISCRELSKHQRLAAPLKLPRFTTAVTSLNYCGHGAISSYFNRWFVSFAVEAEHLEKNATSMEKKTTNFGSSGLVPGETLNEIENANKSLHNFSMEIVLQKLL